MKVKKICILGILISLSMILSYVESLVNIVPAIPGFKLGFANICVLFCLYKFNAKDAFIVLMLRVILVSFIFSNFSALIYSLSGALLALFTMVLLQKTKAFSVYAVSTAGAVMHNMGQLITACIVLNTKACLYYMPFLIIVGVISGFLMGIISGELIKKITFTEKII